MNDTTTSKKSPPKIDVAAVKAAAAGRWPEIVSSIGGIPADILDGRHHPCPRCGGTDRFRMFADDTGGAICNQCFSTGNGDGIGVVRWLLGIGFAEALELIGDYVGIGAAAANNSTRDLIAEICREKRMPLAAFMQFNPTIEKRGRGKNDVVRVPVWNEHGERHSYFDLVPGGKGWCKRGKGMAGLFLPGRLPATGETWLLAEGCKDSTALVGLGFNACGLPTSSMADKYARLFAGVNIILAPDLDVAGQAGAQLTGGRLFGIAASVRVARLPGEIVASHGADVRDVLRRPDGERLVRDAIESATPWTPRDGEHSPKDGRPEVLVTLMYGLVCDQVTEHLGRLGWQTPWIPEGKRERLKLYQRNQGLPPVLS